MHRDSNLFLQCWSKYLLRRIICDFYRARKIENEHNTTVFEIAGTSERINAFIKEISKIVDIEVVRSGPIAISSLIRDEEK